MSDNADEVSVERIDNTSNEKGPEEVLFLGKSIISSLFTSGNNFSTLVPGVEVDDIPDSNKGVWNNHENVSGSDVSSGWTVVRVEEFDKETGSDDCWDKEEYGNKYKPPMDVVIQDEVEDLNESGKNK